MIPEVKEGMKLASDIEAIGFLDVVYRLEHVHCLASIDVDTEELYLFHDRPEFDNVKVFDPYDNQEYVIPERTGTLKEGLKFWKQVAQARSTPRGCKGPHGLQAWGARQGINKPEVTDWKEMDAFKLHRVIEDVKIQKGTYEMLNKEANMLADKGITFDYAYKYIEVPYVISASDQELRGAKLDVEHVERCIEDLDNKIKTLAEEIEPNLPPTVKVKSSKITNKELAEALGIDPKRTKDKYTQRKKDGEVIWVVDKKFYKPSTNFYKTQKIKSWRASSPEHGFSPPFTKKPDLTAWIKSNFPEVKKPTVEWEYEQQVEELKLLNKQTAEYFQCTPTDTDYIVGPHTRVEFIPSRMTQNEVVKSYLIRLGLKSVEEWNLATDAYGNKIKVEKEKRLVPVSLVKKDTKL